MRIGIKKAFEHLHEIEDAFTNVGVPVELGMPHYREHYMRIRDSLPWLANRINDLGVEVLSIHATAMGLDSEIFPTWGAETAEFAVAVGARTITIHPNQSRRKVEDQPSALRALEELQEDWYGRVTFAVETFEGERRLLTPSEISGFNLPMTLDVTHFGDRAVVWDLIRNYRDGIHTVHLSGRIGSNKHQPIDDFCRDIVMHLRKKHWQGNIILEYRDEFADRMVPDLFALRAFIGESSSRVINE